MSASLARSTCSFSALMLAVLVSGCSSSETPTASPIRVIQGEEQSPEQIAQSYIAERRAAGERLFLPESSQIRARFAQSNADPDAAVKGLAAVLSDSSTELRRDAVYLLGALRDRKAMAALTPVLDDAEELVRWAVCDVLAWLKPNDAETQAKLARMVREDSSVTVRVAAAKTLERNDEDAIAAFKQGLAIENPRVREECEEILEKLGKLELPLPEGVYRSISYDRYQEFVNKKEIQRRVVKNGRIYFEVTKLFCTGPPNHAIYPMREWYRTDDPAAKGEGK